MSGSPAPPPQPSAPSAIDAASLKRKAGLGAVALTVRTVLVQLTVLGGSIFLYRLLDPVDFGAFAIVQFALAFFAYFGDAGLGAALIQKKEEPTSAELSSVWYLQIVLTLIVVAIVMVGAPQIIRFWPDMPPSGAWLLQALSINLLFTALRVIPAILMERHLQFGRLAILEVLLNVSFYVSAVVLALMGMRVRALVGAVIIQGALGVLAVFLMRPWKPSLRFSIEVLRPLVRYGVFYQGKTILGFITSAVSPVYGGRVLGQYGVGLLTWAQNTAFFPLQLVAIVSRVTFPLYSRMQEDRKLFISSLEGSVQLTCIVTLGMVGVFLGLGENLIHVIFTDKWMPALPLFYIFSLGIAMGFLMPLVATALDATGRAGVTLRVTILVTAMIWVLVPLGTHFYDATGFAAAYAGVMWVGNIIMIAVLKRVIPGIRLWRRVRAPIVAMLAMVVVARYAVQPWSDGALTLPIGVIALIAVFFATLGMLDPAAVRKVWGFLRKRRR